MRRSAEVVSLTDYDIRIGKSSKKVSFARTWGGNSGQEKYDVRIVGDSNSEVQKSITIENRSASVLTISIDHKIYTVSQLKRSPSSVDFLLNGSLVRASLSRKATQRFDSEIKSTVASVSEIVVSNFPAKVVAVKAAKGTKLKEGETLVILETMKMEAQVKAPKNCEVLEVYIKDGDMISRGAKLAHLRFL